jgi:hypothetical protein
MEHPRAAYGVTPSRGRHWQPGTAGSAVALVVRAIVVANRMCMYAWEN